MNNIFYIDCNCPITLSEMINPVNTDCNHRFEKNALYKHIVITNSKAKCPICRHRITTITTNSDLATISKARLGEYRYAPARQEMESSYPPVDQGLVRNKLHKTYISTLDKLNEHIEIKEQTKTTAKLLCLAATFSFYNGNLTTACCCLGCSYLGYPRSRK